MLDIQLLRSNTAAVAERLARRGYDFDTARFDALEERRKSVQVKTEELQASRNSISKQIGALKGQGKHEEAQAVWIKSPKSKPIWNRLPPIWMPFKRIGRMVVEHT